MRQFRIETRTGTFPSLNVVIDFEEQVVTDQVESWLRSHLADLAAEERAEKHLLDLDLFITDDLSRNPSVYVRPDRGSNRPHRIICLIGDRQEFGVVDADIRMAASSWLEALLPIDIIYSGPALIGWDFADLLTVWRDRIAVPFDPHRSHEIDTAEVLIGHYSLGDRSLSNIDAAADGLVARFGERTEFLWSCVDREGEDRFALLYPPAARSDLS